MTKLATKIPDALKAHLRPGEELRSVGQLTSGLPYWLALGILSLIFTKPWWAGVTGDRLILIQLDALSRPRPDSLLSVPLDHVDVEGKSLLIHLPGDSGALGLAPALVPPTRFRCHFGHPRISGLDVGQFLAAVSTPSRPSSQA
ncbi:MAG: hypothetical protein ACLQGV_18735 [Bryobacteraceae bacterium]